MDRHLPDKAIDLIDEAAMSACASGTWTAPPRYRKLEDEITKVRGEKEDAIEAQEFEKGRIAPRQGAEGRRRSASSRTAGTRRSRSTSRRSARTRSRTSSRCGRGPGLQADRGRVAEADPHGGRAPQARRRSGRRQSSPSPSRSAARAGIKDPKRPTGSFIFLGPSGVGKTELVHARRVPVRRRG